MPENAMFYLDIRNGKAYFRGDIYAEDGYFRGEVHATGGEFTGIVKATDFLTQDGQSMLTNGKFNSRYLDLGNIQIDGDTGDITMTGDINMGSASNITMGGSINMGGDITLGGNITLGGTISWSTANSPTLVLYAQSAQAKPTRAYASYPASSASGWHKTMGPADKFASYTYDGGATWTDAVKIVGDDGEDGKPGSSANVPKYIHDTYIGPTEIQSPTILANDYYIYPFDETDYTGTFNIFGMRTGSSSQYHMFQIKYEGGYTTPEVRLHSPGGATIYIGSATGGTGRVCFDGFLDFSTADDIWWGKNAPKAVFG